jgi:chromosome segregation ATPase
MSDVFSGEVTATAAAAPEAEAPETTEPKVDKPQDEFAEKFMRLARRERALQQQAQELKAKQAEMEKLRSELDSFQQRKSKLKENPFDALEMLGVNYDELTQSMLQYGQPKDELAEIKEQLKAIQERDARAKEEAEKAEKERLQKDTEQMVSAFRQELENFVNSSEYELIKANEATELVYEVIRADYEAQKPAPGENKRVMTHKEACEKVEAYLEQQVSKLLELNKVKAKLAPQEPSPKSESFEAAVSKPAVSQTLTNSMKATSEVSSPQKFLNDDESLRKAASLIKFI